MRGFAPRKGSQAFPRGSCRAGLGGLRSHRGQPLLNPNPTVGTGSASPFISVNMPLHAMALPPPPRLTGNEATLSESLRGQGVSLGD